jgi:hypothetical protein
MASLVRPAQNPPFNLPDYTLVRLAGLTPAQAHLEHTEEADHSIEGIVPMREAALDFVPEAIVEFDSAGIRPLEQPSAEFSPAVLIALRAERAKHCSISNMIGWLMARS